MTTEAQDTDFWGKDNTKNTKCLFAFYLTKNTFALRAFLKPMLLVKQRDQRNNMQRTVHQVASQPLSLEG